MGNIQNRLKRIEQAAGDDELITVIFEDPFGDGEEVFHFRGPRRIEEEQALG